MTSIISIVNQKGGVGKTTTTVNLSAYIARKRKRVLLIDMDPQGNATSGLGINKLQLEKTIYDVMVNDVPMSETILHTAAKNVDICPTNINLAGAEIELVTAMSREFILKNAIETIKDQYDYIFIDCPPSLGLMTLNSLAASNGVIVPILGEYYALEGLGQLVDTINLVKKKLNPNIDIVGVVLTMFDTRTQLSRQVRDEVVKYFGNKVFRTYIPRNVRLAEAPSHGKTILDYESKSKGAIAYFELATEVLKRTT